MRALRLPLLMLAALSLPLHAPAQEAAALVEDPVGALEVLPEEQLDGYIEPLDYYMYRVELRLFAGDTVSMETQLTGQSGADSFSSFAVVRGIVESAGGQEASRLVSLLIADGAGRGEPRIGAPVWSAAQQQALEAAQQVRVGNFVLWLYAPGSDRFEAQVYRTHVWIEGDVTLEPGEQPYATLSGVLETPQLDLVETPNDASLLRAEPVAR